LKLDRPDRLEEIFTLREEFMKEIAAKRGVYGEWPVDITQKKSQQLIREITLKGVEELFEALGELKNWKSHRIGGDPQFDREHFLEEMIDSFNYFTAALILIGVTPQEFFEAFLKKDDVIHRRLEEGY
jgi:hypothetical protein